MKKTIIRLLFAFAICAVVLPSCKKKTGSASSDGSAQNGIDSDSIKKSELAIARSTGYDEAYAPAYNDDGVDRLIHIIDMMGTEIMKNPSQAEYIANRFENLGNQIDENTPVSVRDIKNLNDAVVQMLAKVVYGGLLMQGIDPDDLSPEQDEAIEEQFSNISDQLAYSTASARTLGQYVWQMAEFLSALQ